LPGHILGAADLHPEEVGSMLLDPIQDLVLHSEADNSLVQFHHERCDDLGIHVQLKNLLILYVSDEDTFLGSRIHHA